MRRRPAFLLCALQGELLPIVSLWPLHMLVLLGGHRKFVDSQGPMSDTLGEVLDLGEWVYPLGPEPDPRAMRLALGVLHAAAGRARRGATIRAPSHGHWPARVPSGSLGNADARVCGADPKKAPTRGHRRLCGRIVLTTRSPALRSPAASVARLAQRPVDRDPAQRTAGQVECLDALRVYAANFLKAVHRATLGRFDHKLHLQSFTQIQREKPFRALAVRLGAIDAEDRTAMEQALSRLLSLNTLARGTLRP